MRAVANSTPLIALALIDRLSLLPAVFDEVLVSRSVYEEVAVKGGKRPGAQEVRSADWLQVKEVSTASALPAELIGLDTGELDTILLAREVNADWVLMDERLGRRVAQALGLRVMGTLGLLLTAHYAGLLSRQDAEDAAERLAGSAVRVSSRLLQWFKAQLTPK